MKLEKNVFIHPEQAPGTAPDDLFVSIGTGFVYLINASGQDIQTVTVDSVSVTLPAGGFEGTNLNQCANFVPVPRISTKSGPVFLDNSLLTVTFVGGNAWSQFVALNISNFPPSDSIGIWCFYNGFVVSDIGSMTQASWRSA